MAIETEAGDGGGETNNGSRLRLFLTSLFSSIGGVLGGIVVQEEEEEDMASRDVVVVPRQQAHRG